MRRDTEAQKRSAVENLWYRQIRAIDECAAELRRERAAQKQSPTGRLRVLRPHARWELIGLWRTPEDEWHAIRREETTG